VQCGGPGIGKSRQTVELAVRYLWKRPRRHQTLSGLRGGTHKQEAFGYSPCKVPKAMSRVGSSVSNKSFWTMIGDRPLRLSSVREAPIDNGVGRGKFQVGFSNFR